MNRSLPAITLLTLGLTLAPAQQTDQASTIRARTNLVYVDVTVTDEYRNVIHGLKAEDFAVREDGVAQTITSFEEHQLVTGDVERKLTPLPPGTFTNATAVPSAGPVTILLLDRLNMGYDFQVWTNEQLVRYVRTMLKPGTPVAILGLNMHLEFIQGFTTDKDVLIAALRGLRNRPRQSPLKELPCPEIKAGNGYGINLCEPPPSPAELVGKAAIAKVDTATAYKDLARYLASIPGRKNLVSFSDDPVAKILSGETPPRQMDRLESLVKTFDDNHIAVHYLAHTQVGLFIPADVERVVDQGATYYTLTYDPTNKNLDGKFREIQVKLAKRGLTLSYRQGYYSDDASAKTEHASLIAVATPAGDAAQTARHDAINTAMLHGMPAPSQIVFKATVAPAGDPTERLVVAGNEAGPKTHGPFRNYEIRYSIPLDALALAANSAVDLEFVAIVYDADGNFINSSVRPIKATLTPNAIAKMRDTGLQFHQEISVPAKGDYFLRIAVHDRASDKVGALEFAVESIKGLPADAARKIASTSANHP